MDTANFDTPDGDEVEIEAEDVIQLRVGEEEGTTVIELEDGEEVVVVATQLEVAADLGLDPLEYLSTDANDELDDLDEDTDAGEEEG